MLLLENHQLLGGNSNSMLMSDDITPPPVDYFPMTACILCLVPYLITFKILNIIQLFDLGYIQFYTLECVHGSHVCVMAADFYITFSERSKKDAKNSKHTWRISCVADV